MDNLTLKERFAEAFRKSQLTYHQAAQIVGISHARLRKWVTRLNHPSILTQRDMNAAISLLEVFISEGGRPVKFPSANHGKFLHKAPIAMPTSAWVKLEELRATTPAGEYLAGLIDLASSPQAREGPGASRDGFNDR